MQRYLLGNSLSPTAGSLLAPGIIPQFGNPSLALLMSSHANAQQFSGVQAGALPPAVLLQLLALQNQNMAPLQVTRPSSLDGNPNTQATPAASFAGQIASPVSRQPQSNAGPAPAPTQQQDQISRINDESGQPGAKAMASNPAVPSSVPAVSGRQPILMYTELDEGRLTPYQVCP